MSNMDAFASNEVQVKRFADLSEQEILALAITNEEEDSRIYRGFAEGLREQFPASAKVFDEMADEEVRHRTMLFDLYRTKFGEYLPLIRRQDVKDRKSTRLNSSHVEISYAVFCLKKKNISYQSNNKPQQPPC